MPEKQFDVAKFIDFSKPFIDASKNIFKQMVQTELETGKPFLKEKIQSQGDISAVIGINGVYKNGDSSSEFRGQFVISFPTSTYLKVASAMLMEEYTEFNEEIADVGAEICNMIIGNAKGELVRKGYEIEMAIPSVVSGIGHTIQYLSDVNIIVTPIQSGHGEFYMEICYNE
ncbi:MAG: chemotaxis protein CheX [Halobacteriovoraceae bacterium]|jgi:chemotaxis protein CheX|nr:chemotaxis protein CheX [Halobacteriovoraceae bacterium]MBT5095745.1 chemotaxis protein CheX [Halobacteriovoraceae bacterium]